MGFTGNIEFDNEGRRTNFRLHYSKLNTTSQFTYAGYWDSKTDLITNKYDSVVERSSAFNSDSKLRVTLAKFLLDLIGSLFFQVMFYVFIYNLCRHQHKYSKN